MEKSIVLDLGFGDNGKGRVVDKLTSSKKSCVIRFSGGQQCAHHVIHENGDEHVFSSFGSGTINNCPTIITKFCTIDPVSIMIEYDILKKYNPIIYIDKKCPITTPYDIGMNRHDNIINNHGTCGQGVGRTWKREEDFYSLTYNDIYYPSILKMKLNNIKTYYANQNSIIEKSHFLENQIQEFLFCCGLIRQNKNIKIYENDNPLLSYREFDKVVYEGSQGILLDQNIGFFPHVTRSNTDLTNVPVENYDKLYLVTRAYQTRHGNGPMTNEHIPHNIKENPYEKNISDGIQGKLRISLLDLDLLRYSIDNLKYSCYLNKILVITCLDLIENEYRYTKNGNIHVCNNETEFIKEISNTLKIPNVLLSRKPYGDMEFIRIS